MFGGLSPPPLWRSLLLGPDPDRNFAPALGGFEVPLEMVGPVLDTVGALVERVIVTTRLRGSRTPSLVGT